jgi:hypothetical protein
MQNLAKLFDGFIPTQAMPDGFVQLQGERRIIDTVLGEALGYERPQEIRRVIRRKSGILQEFGILPDGATMPDQAGACPEFLLNCAQATSLISHLGTIRSNLPIARNAYGWLSSMIKAANSGEFEPENAARTIFFQDVAKGLGMLGPENTRLQEEVELLRAEKAPPEWREPVDEDEQIKLCWNWRAYLDVCERQFIISILGETRLNRHQAADLWGIVIKIRNIARNLGRTT